MRVYEAPHHVPNPTRLFLGGGISNCPNWQADAIERLSHIEELTIFNPRRDNFPMDDPEAAGEQILWEHHMLRRSDIIVFWFPKETLCPITLYEFGYWTGRDPRVQVIAWCHPEYMRLQDVEIQTELAEPDIPVVVGFDNFIAEIEWSIP